MKSSRVIEDEDVGSFIRLAGSDISVNLLERLAAFNGVGLWFGLRLSVIILWRYIARLVFFDGMLDTALCRLFGDCWLIDRCLPKLNPCISISRSRYARSPMQAQIGYAS